VSALVPYKRVEVAIEACRLAGERLVIVGTGPDLGRLQAQANAAVEFLGWRTDEEIRALYRQARAVLLPGEEDFGIVPVEAMACGTPVVALAAGGALETVVDGVTGLLVATPDADLFAEAIRGLPDLSVDGLRAQAERFGPDRFSAALLGIAADLLTCQGPDARW
jgi:glycosyltransferase involved in cell wall biosynthesis